MKASFSMGAFEIVLQCPLLSVGIYLSLGSTASWIIGQILLGICFWRSFAIMHACGHHAFTSKNKLDDLIGMFMSLFCFIPYFAWKFIHHDHHKWTGWIDLDPTMRNVLEKKNPKMLRLLDIAWWSWIPVISVHYIATVFFRTSLHDYKKRIHVLFSILTIVLVHLFLAIVLKGAYFRIFALSAFIYLNIGDLSLLTQHVHIPMDHSQGRDVPPKKTSEQADYSHTMILPAFVSRWVILNFNHHALHHLHPKLPYYKSHQIPYTGKHTHDWKEWIVKAKTSKVSELIYHD